MAHKVILITRLFDADPSLVFDCWLKPEHLIQWYNAGGGWTTPHADSDAKAGGRFNIGFQSPDGKEGFDFTGTYDEITPPAKGRDGRIVFSTDDARTMTVEFADQSGRTLVTLHLALENVHPEEQQRQGWSAMLENLGKYLERRTA